MAILRLANTKAPFGAEGILLVPNTPQEVKDQDKLDVFMKNPGTVAMVKAGKLIVEGYKPSPPKTDPKS
jgi:hypothetical protein